MCSISYRRPYGDAPLLVLAPPTSSAGSANQLVHYESVRAVPRKKAVHIPAEVFEEHPEVVLRNDLVDCGVDICSLDVSELLCRADHFALLLAQPIVCPARCRLSFLKTSITKTCVGTS